MGARQLLYTWLFRLQLLQKYLFSDVETVADADADAADLCGENVSLLYDTRICVCVRDGCRIADAFNWLISIYDIADLGLCIFVISSAEFRKGWTATAAATAMSSDILIYRNYVIVFMLFHSMTNARTTHTRGC